MEIIDRNVDELKKIYKERRPGGHWFDKDTMRLFETRLHKIVQIGLVWLFVTSERSPSSLSWLFARLSSLRSMRPVHETKERKYSVRWMSETGNIETMENFCSMTESEANNLFQECIEVETERLREGRQNAE